MSTLFGKRAQRFISVALSVTMIVWTLGVVAFTPVAAATLNEGDLIRGPDGVKVYIINNTGYKRHIFNPEVFNMYGHLKWENIKAVDQTTLDSYKTSDLYRADGDQKVYQTADDGVKRWFNVTGAEFMTKYTFDQVFVVNTKERDFYSTGSEITASELGIETPVTGALNVSVDSSVAAATIVSDTTSTDGAQALADVLKLSFTGSGKVTSLKIHRQGISADSDVSNLYLYDGDTVLADSASVSSTYFTFTNSAGLFTVSDSKTVTVKMDLANGTGSGKTLQFGVAAATDITSDATSLGGTFPMNGNVMSTATTGDLGKITLAHNTDPGTSMEAGLTDQEVWKFNLTTSDQKIKISKIKVTAIGTIQADDLTNFKLNDGTNQVGSTVAAMDSDKTVTFNISPAYEIASGQTKNVSLRADIVKGTSRTFYFEIKSRADIVAMDANYGVNLKLNQADTYSIIAATNTTTISAGSLQITKASDSASGNIAKDALNVSLAKFNFKAVGEDIKIDNLMISALVSGTDDTDLDNGKILVDGAQVGTTKDLESETDDDDTSGVDTDATDDDDTLFSLGSSFIAKAGVTHVVEIVADVKKGDGTSYTNETVQVGLEYVGSNAIRQSTGTALDAPSDETMANSLTVTAAALSAAKNGTIANMTVLKGATGVTIGSWLVTAGAAEAVSVNSIVLKDETGGGETWGDAFNNLKLYSGSTQLGSTITSPTATGDNVAQTFNLSTALNVTAGQSVQIDLVADVLTGASWTADEIDVTSIAGTGVSTSTSVSYSTATAGQTVTVATSGTLTIANEATPTMPNSEYRVAGDTGVTVAAWKFTADNREDLKVTRIKVWQAQTDANAISNVRNLKLYVGSSQVGSTVPALTDNGTVSSADEYALFESATGLFTVPKNGNTTVKLMADITDSSNAALAANGEQFKFAIYNGTADVAANAAPSTGSAASTLTATSMVSAKGSTSGTYAAAAATATAYTSNSQYVVSTKPTFALASGSPTVLSTADMEVMRFTISAHSADDVVFDGTAAGGTITFSITGSDSGTTTGKTADLYDYTTGSKVATQLTSQDNASGQTLAFVTVSTTIPAGSTKTYYLKTDMGGYTGQFDSAKFSIANTSAHVKWSDGTYTNSIDGTITGFGLPLDGNTLVRQSLIC